MMNSIKSAKLHLVKFLFLLPIVAVLLLSFRKESMKSKFEENSTIVRTNILEKRLQTGLDQNQINLTDALKDLDTIPEKRKVNKAKVIVPQDSASKPIIIVDDRRMEKDFDLNSISPNDIQSIDILKGASAVEAYGDVAVNGAIQVRTKDFSENKTFLRIRGVASDKQPLFVFDGKPITETELKLMDQNDIENITVLKNTSIREMYGDQAKHGVVLITSKKLARKLGHLDSDSLKKEKVVVVGYATKSKAEGSVDKLPSDVYYILNGNPISYDEAKKIKSENIKSIDVLKGDAAKKYYGDKAKSGAIILTTK